jgi:hypothetical protein
MFHRWAALVLVLAFCAMTPKYAAGQQTQQSPREHGASGAFGRPYPNPFNPEVHIPFSVDTTACTDGSQQHRVTMRILNILAQQVAIPDLEVRATTSTPSPATLATGPINNLPLGCGFYTAYWSGDLQGTHKEAASGTYLVQLFIDGKPRGTKRIFNGK